MLSQTSMAYTNTPPEAPKPVQPKTAYLRQCFAAVHTKQTLAVDCYLGGAHESDSAPALTLHNRFSRFAIGLIDNSGTQRQIMTANIREKEFAELQENYWLARQAMFNRQLEAAPKSEEKRLPPAYTVQLRAGQLKGRTPAEILLADPNQKSELLRHKAWLETNVAQYPANRKIMEAIDNAVQLLETNALSSEVETRSSTVIAVWQRDFKVTGSGPTRTKTRISITCEMESQNPWAISVENTEHPVNGNEPDLTTVLARRYGTIHLNNEEMAGMINRMKNLLKYFEANEYEVAKAFIEANDWHKNK